MEASLIVDLCIAAVLIFALWDGWRHGFSGSLFTVGGVALGLVIGVAAAPPLMKTTEDPQLRMVIGVVTLVVLALVGYVLGSTVGFFVRGVLPPGFIRRVDSLVGAVFQTVVMSVVVWLVAMPIADGTSRLSQGVRESTVLHTVDDLSPTWLAAVTDRMRSLIHDSRMPLLLSPFNKPEATAVEAPRIRVENTAMVNAVRPSIVHVVGDAPQCHRRLMGSGFVLAEDRVITNAHVVAGTTKVQLDTINGMRPARVVYYNPSIDIAIIASDKLGLPPLPWADVPAERSDDAVFMGFPESGPFEADPARIIDSYVINSPTIYAGARVDREAYIVRGNIRHGNSGGPLLTPDGRVLGVIFGAAADSTDTGYALTRAEVDKHLGNVEQLYAQVETQRCV